MSVYKKETVTSLRTLFKLDGLLATLTKKECPPLMKPIVTLPLLVEAFQTVESSSQVKLVKRVLKWVKKLQRKRKENLFSVKK